MPKENISPEERARRIREANRLYFKAAGKMEDFYLAYPSERPPEREPQPKPEPQPEPQRERGGRGDRSGGRD